MPARYRLISSAAELKVGRRLDLRRRSAEGIVIRQTAQSRVVDRLPGAAANVAGCTWTAQWRVRHLSRTRVPRIFWLLSALRKFGTSRSISSKYDDSAGVFCCAL